MKIALVLLSITFIASSYLLESKLKATTSFINYHPGEFNLEDTTYFTLVRDYIEKNGDAREENASGTMDKEMIITYHFLVVDSMEVSIDHSDRIYMNLKREHYGNILKENGKVRPEIVYGVPDTNPTLTKQKEKKVLAIYRALIVMALRK